MNVGTLTISLTARTASLAKAAASVKAFEGGVIASVQRVNASIASVGMAFSALTIPIAAIGIGATKMFSEFEFSLAKVEGLVGIAHEQTMQWGSDVLELSKTIGVSANEMGDALYYVTSAGIRGENTMKVLKASAQASAAGMGESKDIADLLTSAINAYGEANLSVADSMDILVTAVREGKVEASDLILSLGKVLPISSAMGVSFNEVGASIAALTRTGTKARTAGMMVRRLLLGFQKPAQGAKAALGELGSTFAKMRDVISNEKGGLLKAMLKLNELTKESGNVELLANVFPNLRAYLPALDLLGNNLEKNKSIWMSMLEPMGNFKNLLEVTGDTFQKQFAIAVNAAGQALVQLGHTFAQNLIPIIQGFAEKMNEFSEWWTELPRGIQNAIIKFTLLVGVIGPLLILFSSLVGMILSVTSALYAMVSSVLINGVGGLILSIHSLGKAFMSLSIISGVTSALSGFRAIVTSTALINGIGALITSLGKLLGVIMSFSAGAAIVALLVAIAAMVVLVVTNFEQWKLSMPKIMDEIKLELAKFFAWANEQMAKFFDWLESPEGFNKLGKFLNNLGGVTAGVFGIDVENPQEWWRQAVADNTKIVEDLEKKLADPKNYAEGAMTMGETFMDSISNLKEEASGLLDDLLSKLNGSAAGTFPGGGDTLSLYEQVKKSQEEAKKAADMFEVEPSFVAPSDFEMILLGLPKLEAELKQYQDLQSVALNPAQWQKYKEKIDETTKSIAAFKGETKETMDVTKETIDITKKAINHLSNAFISFGTILGNALSGDLGTTKFFESILLAVFAFTEQLGKALVAAGVAALAFEKLLINPVAAIVAGVALIALSVAASNMFKAGPAAKMAKGGTVPGGFPNDTYPALLSSGEKVLPEPLALSGESLGGQQIRLLGEFRIKKGDLVYSLNEGNYAIERTR